MILNKELVHYQDNLYYVYRKLNLNQIKSGFLDDVKQFWDCDIVVKRKNQEEDFLFFLRLIEDAELVD
jgi:hypothetical protein